MEVVPGRVLRIDRQVDAVLVDQVLKLLFHEADHHRDVRDAGLVELADRPLDQRLSVDFEECFGGRRVDRDHPHAEARCQNDGVARRFGADLLPSFVRELHVVVQIAVLGKLAQGFVDTPYAVACGFRQDPLVNEVLLAQDIHNF